MTELDRRTIGCVNYSRAQMAPQLVLEIVGKRATDLHFAPST